MSAFGVKKAPPGGGKGKGKGKGGAAFKNAVKAKGAASVFGKPKALPQSNAQEARHTNLPPGSATDDIFAKPPAPPPDVDPSDNDDKAGDAEADITDRVDDEPRPSFLEVIGVYD